MFNFSYSKDPYTAAFKFWAGQITFTSIWYTDSCLSNSAHGTGLGFPLALARPSPGGLQNGRVYSTAGSRKTPPYGKRGTTYNDLQCTRQHGELHGSAQRGLLSSVIPDISQSVREISLLQGPESARNHSMNGLSGRDSHPYQFAQPFVPEHTIAKCLLSDG